MTGNKVAYEMTETANEQAINKVGSIFQTIQGFIDGFEPLLKQATYYVQTFSQFQEDVNSISSACLSLSELATVERAQIIDKIIEGKLSEENLKSARHDLRAKVSAILGYSELIQEELQDMSDGDDFDKVLGAIVGSAKNLIPIIDGLRVDEVVQSEGYQSNDDSQNSAAMTETMLTYGEQFAYCTVLIIDDSAYNREILRRRLSRYGVNVLTAENGMIGLEMIAEHAIDLVLLDIMMPVMNGYEVLTNLKAEKKTKDIPVLMISALSEVDSIVRCIEAGAEDYLPTPFNPIVLHARIKACLEKKILRDREQETLNKLASARKKLETAIESLDDGFAVFDENQKLSLCNKPFELLYPAVVSLGGYGFTFEELLRENYKLNAYFEERRGTDHPEADVWEKQIQETLLKQNSGEKYYVRMKDSRWIEVVNSSTPDGGMVSIHKDVTLRKADEDRLTHQALHDSLTGLQNRASFEAHLGLVFDRASNSDLKFSLMFLDLDGFKNINDTLGHDVGDQVLIHVSQGLLKCVRDEDIVARLGGDEFAVILDKTVDKEMLAHISDRILSAVGDHYIHKGQKVPFGVSIGLACYPEDGENAEALLASSDAAMYLAKKSGKGQYKFSAQISKS